MLPIGWRRDFILLGALCLAGGALGGTAGHAGVGVAAGALFYLGSSLRRVQALHRWLMEGVLRAEPPVHGGMLGDLADRVRHQQARLQQELDTLGSTIVQLREAYSALRDGIVILGPGDSIDWFNSSARELLDLRHPDDIGRQLVNLLRNPDFAAYLHSGDYTRDFEFSPSGAGSRVLVVQVAAFGQSNRVLFVRDVTTLRHLETMRRDFVANISHELRTPLTVITGYLDTFEGMLPADRPAAARALEQMREQAARMERLLKDLLLLSRLEGAEDTGRERVALDAVLGTVRESALAACGGARHIELDCEPGVVLMANRLQLESIVGNLVFNAVQYTADGGTIRIGLRPEGAWLVFSVSDDGIGIDPVHIPRLTERFYRVDKSRSVAGGGTGLGLAIVKHALNRLGGRLEVESRPGAGSTFRCRLPAQLRVAT
jgi:two-component system phosphate regulon sensor histidine kinase PhoR